MKCVVYAVLLSGLAVAQSRPPKLLTDGLQRLPGLAILDPAIDLVGATEFDAVKKYAVRSWVESDLDRDGAPDVAAVVVSRAREGTRFGVLAVLSTRPAQVYWILPLGDRIYGVEAGHGVVGPRHCIECDYFQAFRWSGRAFVENLYDKGDILTLADQDIFSLPNENARVSAKSGPCVRVKAVDFRGADPLTRWYLIETVEARPKRGWVPASAIGTNEWLCSWNE